jgi:predicted small integral membrane protein
LRISAAALASPANKWGNGGVDKIDPGMAIRLCKASLVAAMALLLALVAFNNIVDYGDNWNYVQHVMGMDAVFPGSTQRWRAIHSAPVQQLVYLAIIGAEALSGGLLTLGAAALFRQARSASGFDRALALPAAGLTVAMLLYGAGFVAVGGEWFLMWQSKSWGGSDAAGRFFLLNGTVLIVLLAGRAPAAAER